QDYALSRQILNSVGFVNQAAVFLNAMLLVQDGKTAEADSLLAELVKSGNSDIAHKSWLERLKILFGSEPVEAIRQLNDFIQSKPNAPYQHERYYLAAFFAFLQEDYLQTLKWLNQSILTSHTRAQTERAEILSIEAWYRLGRLAEAASLSQRFIEQSPASEHLAKALYFSGLAAFETKDLELAQSQFKQLLALNSPLAQEAEFYLGEIEFFHANYNLALEHYQALIEKHGSSQLLLLRAAQSRYFIKDYTAARAWLDSIPAFQRDSDYYLLSGSILFNQRQYQTALYEYEQALSKATSDLMKTELSSYQALTLYQLGRFAEASRIYLSLSSLPESPDIYHYLAAKSAYQAGNYMQALDLYDSFLDLFPESDYILEVVSEIAKANYNLGNYMDAL
ncbi:MAG TPA: tetratricopeptide repeat protein, partial [Candidatus Cloacimonadota bacterium]|nr:tetratricopeptide repeat protein [Candidatus Cloacimonadota bacterium]